MKQKRGRSPIPQREFGFTTDTFNLFQQTTADGDRIVKEQEQTALARKQSEKAQRKLFKQK